MKNRAVFALFLCLALSGTALALTTDGQPSDPREIPLRKASAEPQRLDLEQQGPVETSARRFVETRGGQWEFRVDRRTGKAALAQGSGVPLVPGRGNSMAFQATAAPPDGIDLDGLEPVVRSFVAGHAELLEPAEGVLVLDRKTSQIRDRGRLASVYYNWEVDGVPVEDATVFVRVNSGNVIQFGSTLLGTVDVPTRPTVSSREAVDAAMQHSGDGEVYRIQGEPELLLQPVGDADTLRYRLVWKITYTVLGRIETWEARVDAHDAEVIAFRDTNFYARAVGSVYPRTVFGEQETRVPMPLVEVVSDGNGVTATNAGAFGYAGGTFSSALEGPFFDTDCQGCTNPPQPAVTGNDGIGWVDFGSGGQDDQGNGLSTSADRNTFFHLSQVRRIGVKWLPGESWLFGTITSNVNITNTCNAVYNGEVNFYRSGDGCNNTGELADVIYHEWGHGLDLNTRGGSGGTSEGTADVVSMHMTRSNLVGPGFRTNGNPVRNLDRNVVGLVTFDNAVSACGGGTHCQGQAFGQASWELANALVARYGYHTGWRTSERLFFTSLPDQGEIDPSSSLPIYDAYIAADDDDGNLANGTPNAQEIFDAFDDHAMANAQVPTSPACSRPDQPVLTVSPQCEAFDLSWSPVTGAQGYEIFRAEVRVDAAFFPVADVPNADTSFVDTDVAPGVDYWYVVMATDASGCESTVENPIAARLTAQPILSVSAAVADDVPRGNRSGFADPGEEVDVVLTLANFGEIDGETVTGTVVSTTPGVTVTDGTTAFASIASGGSGANQDVIRFETDAGSVSCGDMLQFQFIPDEGTGCSEDTSYFELRLGEFDGSQFVCDDTPACFVKPDFDGIQSAAGGSSCAETVLGWSTAQTNCTNATISYNVYRSTDPAFVPDASTRIAENLPAPGLVDTLLEPGQVYHYAVRAFDSRSGEEENVSKLSVAAPTTPDIRAPLFAGLAAADTGAGCGQTVLTWGDAAETCNAPVSYEIYRSTDPLFTPSPANRIGSTLSVGFTDAALDADTEYTYLVRARDGVGNEDANALRVTVASSALDRIDFATEFEPDDASWTVVAPDDAESGNWEWGDPSPTAYQSDDDATPDGVNAWITGLAPGPSNNDIDGGTTTLLTGSYDLSAAVNPVVRYARWFNNDKGAAPNEASDAFAIEVSNNDGGTWSPLETVSCGGFESCPLEWQVQEIALDGIIGMSSKMRFRFTAADLGAGSLVEAGIDDFTLLDRGQGCLDCVGASTPVGTIVVDRSGDDVVIDWSADPVEAANFVVYALSGPTFAEAVRVGTSETKSFVHEGAVGSAENFFYRITAVDACGAESALE